MNQQDYDELDAMCELLTQDVRVAKLRAYKAEVDRDLAVDVAGKILAARQLEVAATIDLLDHIDMVGPTDALTKKLIANVRRALGQKMPAERSQEVAGAA
jgi:hypothetical protein